MGPFPGLLFSTLKLGALARWRLILPATASAPKPLGTPSTRAAAERHRSLVFEGGLRVRQFLPYLGQRQLPNLKCSRTDQFSPHAPDGAQYRRPAENLSGTVRQSPIPSQGFRAPRVSEPNPFPGITDPQATHFVSTVENSLSTYSF